MKKIFLVLMLGAFTRLSAQTGYGDPNYGYYEGTSGGTVMMQGTGSWTHTEVTSSSSSASAGVITSNGYAVTSVGDGGSYAAAGTGSFQAGGAVAVGGGYGINSGASTGIVACTPQTACGHCVSCAPRPVRTQCAPVYRPMRARGAVVACRPARVCGPVVTTRPCGPRYTARPCGTRPYYGPRCR